MSTHPQGPDPAGEPLSTPADEQELREIAAALEAFDQPATRGERAAQLQRVGGLMVTRARRVGVASGQAGSGMAQLLLDIAPHLKVRDLPTLKAHHRGLAGEPLADSLTRVAARTTATVGAAGGAAAAIQWAAAPTLLAIPLEVVAETVAVAAIETRLVAELHQVYDVLPQGGAGQRGAAYAMAWAQQRGVNPWRPGTVPLALGIAGRKQIARRMLGRFGRNLGTLVPFLVGAGIGARLNYTMTQRLSANVRADLQRTATERWEAWQAWQATHATNQPPLSP